MVSLTAWGRPALAEILRGCPHQGMADMSPPMAQALSNRGIREQGASGPGLGTEHPWFPHSLRWMHNSWASQSQAYKPVSAADGSLPKFATQRLLLCVCTCVHVLKHSPGT